MRRLALTISVLLAVTALSGRARAAGHILLYPGSRGLEEVQLTDADLGLSAGAGREETVRAIVAALVTPPEALESRGLSTAFPEAARLRDLVVKGPHLIVELDVPEAVLYGELDHEDLDVMSRQVVGSLVPFDELRYFHLVAPDPRAPGSPPKALPLFVAPPRTAAELKEERLGPNSDRTPLTRRVDPGSTPRQGFTGPLTGKLIFVSQCHGWLDYGGSTGWSTQRGITNGIVEDFVNPEAVNQFLLRYLRQAGADFFTLREPDLNTEMIIVDNGDGTAHPANGTYVESGDAGAFSTTTLNSFGNFASPYAYQTSPFTGGPDRLMITSTTETARATWTPVIPTSGMYTVQVSYTRAGTGGTDRARDAHYVVYHDGGATHFRVNQQRHGWTWVYLGRFYFEAGAPASQASVALLNDSSLDPGKTVSADAVRFGGGLGDVQGEYTGTVSGKARVDESAKVYTQFMGAASSVYSGGDPSTRSKFAAYEHFSVEDSVYVSWHSNAFDGTARGTSSYIYSSNPPDGSYVTTEATPGSVELMNLIHDELVNDIRVSTDPTWQDRGYRSAYFAEVNPSYNSEMPAALFEVAFHDNPTDAAHLSRPAFRNVLARAIYQGIVKYFAQRDGTTVDLLPEPPAAPRVVALDSTTLRLSWDPSPTDQAGLYGDGATSYRVYTSRSGYGFDEGTDTVSTTFDLTGLTPGQTVYVRIAGINAGGESLQTETLVGRTPRGPSSASVLVVNGFDRLDEYQLIPQTDSDLGGTTGRMILERMNARNYVVQHAEAARGVEVSLSSASNEAVVSGAVELSGYDAVIWISGEESTADESFSAVEQSLVSSYLSQGGALFVSGSEIAWDLDARGSGADRQFFADWFRAAYQGDDAGVYQATGEVGSALAGLNVGFDDGSARYDVDYPDEIDPLTGATRCMSYVGPGTGACVQVADTYRLLYLGFPFEAIVDPVEARDLMEAALAFLLPTPTATPTSTATATTTATATGSPTPSATPTPPWTPTPSPSPSPSASITPTASSTPTLAASSTPTPGSPPVPLAPWPALLVLVSVFLAALPAWRATQG